MTIPAIGGVSFGVAGSLGTGSVGQAAGSRGLVAPDAASGTSFGDMVQSGLQQVSNMEHSADNLTQAMASGKDVSIQEVMAATTKASLSVDLLVQVRNKAVDAYREIMNLQV